MDTRIIELLREAAEENNALTDELTQIKEQLAHCKSSIAYWRDAAETSARESHELKMSAVRRNNAGENPLDVMKLLEEIVGNPSCNKIKLIKLLRNLTGCGLKESKEAVEEWMESRDRIKVGDVVRVIDDSEVKPMVVKGELVTVDMVWDETDYQVGIVSPTCKIAMRRDEVEKVKG